MKRFLLCLSLFAFFESQAQQVNPVPDYVFRNQMSVGRNAVTDTAAYISIGPRYGANKGLMPPIVSDTAAITGVKRNGLLIFSVQRNNFQYWDSINSRWTSVTANVDTTIISTRAWRKKGDDSLGAVIATRTDTTLLSTRAWRKKGDDSLGAVIATRTDTTLLSTRAWRQKGLDSLAAIEIDGSGTVNYVPKFTATRTLGNSQIFDNGTNVGINTTSIGSGTRFEIRSTNNATNARGILAINTTNAAAANIGGSISFGGENGQAVTPFPFASIAGRYDGSAWGGYLQFSTTETGSPITERMRITSGGDVGIGTSSPSNARLVVSGSSAGTVGAIMSTDVAGTTSFVRMLGDVASQNLINWQDGTALRFATSNQNYSTFAERMRIFANGRVGINTTTDAGYQFDVAGSIRNTTGANFATSSGDVGIGTTSPSRRLTVKSDGIGISLDNTNNNNAAIEYVVNPAKYNWTLAAQRNVNNGFEITPSTAVGGTTYTTPIFTVLQTGNIGINTTAPSEALHVVGRGRFTTIDSTSSPINVLTSDVNGVIRKTAPGVLGSGTTNYIPKFTASGTVGNSQIQDDATSVAIGSIFTTDKFQVTGNTIVTSGMYVGDATARSGGFYNESNASRSVVFTADPGNAAAGTFMGFNVDGATEAMRINSGRELLINTTTDAGDYRLQVNGNANFRDDVLIDTNLRVNRHISLDQTPKAWALGNAIEGPQGSTLFVAGGGVQTLANIYYDGSYKYSTSNPGAAMFLLQSGITFATYGSGTANGALTGANEMVYAGGELRVGIADQGTFKLQVADKSYFGDEVQIASTTDLGNYKLQVTGEAIITAGIRTDAPSGGTAATWKLGTVATVSPTSPNRTIEVEIGGTTYYIHAKTTNN